MAGALLLSDDRVSYGGAGEDAGGGAGDTGCRKPGTGQQPSAALPLA